VGFFRPIILWPFPDGEVLKVAEKVKTILVCELNIDGQLCREVARAAKGKAEVHHLGSGGVEPHLPMQVFNEIRRLYR
jgi:2-oxoglutarate ferredoxin oxidoreductase subunit alpha